MVEHPHAALQSSSLDAQLVMQRNLKVIFQQLGPRCGLDDQAIEILVQLVEQRSYQDRASILLPLIAKQSVGECNSLEAIEATLKLLFGVANRPTAADVITMLCQSQTLQHLLSTAKFGTSPADTKLNAATLVHFIGDELASGESNGGDLLLSMLDKADCLHYRPFIQNLHYLHSCQLSKLNLEDAITQEVLKLTLPAALLQQLSDSGRLETGLVLLEVALRINHPHRPLQLESPAYFKKRLQVLLQGMGTFEERQQLAMADLGYKLLMSKLLMEPPKDLPAPLFFLFAIFRGQGRHPPLLHIPGLHSLWDLS